MKQRIHKNVSFLLYNLMYLLVLLLIIRGVSFADINTITLYFKDSAKVSDTIFTIEDIAKVKADNLTTVEQVRKCKIGTCAPPGYSRFVSRDKVVQFTLKNIFNDDRFISYGPERISVFTQFEEYTISMFSDSLFSYFRNTVKWNADSWTVSIRNEDESFRCGVAPFIMKFEGMANGYPKGNTVLRMIIIQGTVTYKVPVYCTFSIKVPVIITTRDIARKELLDENNCTIRKIDVTKFGPTPFRKLHQLKDKRAARTIKAGSVLHERLVKSIPVVGKDDEVAITVKKGRIQLSVPGIARESGGIGERIWVKNKKSKKLIRAQIEKKGQVIVAQGGRSL